MTLRAEGLKKSYGTKLVVDIDRFFVPAGRTLAVLGPSGAGKSTLLSILALLEKPDQGSVYLDDRLVTVRDKAARMHMAAAFQSPYLFRGTVGENVAYGLKLRGIPAAKRRERVASILARVGLAGWAPRGVGTLSGGEAQRVALARALVLQPSVLFLDEPLASLDPLAKGRLAEDFARIIRADSMTTVYVTHDQSEAMSMADYVLVLREGRQAAVGETAEVMGLPPDDWTADFLGAGAPLWGVVVDSRDGLMTIDVGGPLIQATGSVAPGRRVQVGIRPEDVLLFEGEADIPRSTARNRFLARVVGLRMWGLSHYIMLDIEGAHLASCVSHFSAREMNLAVGASVQAVFKATAVRVRATSEEEHQRSDVPLPKAVLGVGD